MKLRDMMLISLFTALIAVGAFIRVPLPICPITLQILFTTLAGMLLGAKRGAISVAVYVALGLAGVPVFTGGGGLSYIFQPTFGYLLGFCAGAAVTGQIAFGGKPTYLRMLLAGLAGLGMAQLVGLPYYWLISRFYLESPVGIWPMFFSCFVLTVPGDIVLCFLTAELGRRLVPVIGRSMQPPRPCN